MRAEDFIKLTPEEGGDYVAKQGKDFARGFMLGAAQTGLKYKKVLAEVAGRIVESK